MDAGAVAVLAYASVTEESWDGRVGGARRLSEGTGGAGRCTVPDEHQGMEKTGMTA